MRINYLQRPATIWVNLMNVVVEKASSRKLHTFGFSYKQATLNKTLFIGMYTCSKTIKESKRLKACKLRVSATSGRWNRGLPKIGNILFLIIILVVGIPELLLYHV